ncbi:hypothetical protein EC968_001611 [Mortierella alpina]|nr:hypothetical protein EC968_001611 [Mortierella alpina]
MPILALQLKAELENVTELIPADADHTWHFKIQCTKCRDIDSNLITFNAIDKAEMGSGRGEANLVMRCKFCKCEISADFASKPIAYDIENNGRFATIVTIECRGLELVGFEPREGWKAKGAESGTVFEDIDLTEGDWAEYDEKSEMPVGISSIEAKFVKKISDTPRLIMDLVTNASVVIPIHAQPQTEDIVSVTPSSTDMTSHFTRQFLGLRAKLSRAFATHTVVFVLYSAYQLSRTRESITSFASRAKEAVASDCYALEQSTKAVASLPRFAARGVAHGLVTALQTTVSQIGYGLDVVLNGFLTALEVIVTLLTSVWRCFLENLSNSGIPLLSEIGDGGVQAIDQINQAMLSILEKPFSELSSVIRQNMEDPRIELTVHIQDLSIPQVAFCAERLDLVAVDRLSAEMRCWFLYAVVALLVATVCMTACNMVMISYQHRRWRAQLDKVRQALEDFNDAKESRPSHEAVGEREFYGVEQLALQMINIVRHPLLTDFLDWFSRRLLRMKEHSTHRLVWFGHYVAHPPSVTCLLIGLLGLTFTYSQLAVVDYSRSRARPILATALGDLTDIIRNLITAEIQDASTAFALSTNVALSQLESDLNNNVFGSIVQAAGELDSGLKAVQTAMIQGIQAVFGEGAFSKLVLTVLQCLFLNKLAIVANGFVWLQENANIRLPRLSEQVLMPEQVELENLLGSIMGDGMIAPSLPASMASDRLSEGEGAYSTRRISVTEDPVVNVLDLYEDELRKDLPVHYALVGMWYILLVMGLVGARGLKPNT